MKIEDDSDETIALFIKRLADSGSEEQGVYRESEIDAIYNIVELKHRAIAGSGSAVEVQRAARDLEAVREARDLIHDDRIRDAAGILRDWLRKRVR